MSEQRGVDRRTGGLTVTRIMGIETEYGILEPGRPTANAMQLSSYVVAAYAAARTQLAGRARWDYVDEDPLSDARGFRLARASAHPSLLTDDPERPAPAGPEPVARPNGEEYEDPSTANVILTNGARLYVDHAHPEYSAPEVTNPVDGVLWDKAGEQVMLTASRALVENPGLPDVVLYKNNVDGKGSTYGTHENYLMDRAVPFDDIVRYITPFLVTRQVYTGAGRVGLGTTGQEPGYQLSQRADYIEAEVGLETTLRRPIVNTRDEPHADRARWRRLHVIIGDANLLEVATYLKLGATSVVLWLIEHLHELPGAREELEALVLADPVAAVGQVSRDLSMADRLDLVDGRRLTAVQVQRGYLALARAIGPADAQTAAVLDRWDAVLGRLAADPMSCAAEVEWVAKLRLLEGLRSRHGLDWDNPRLAAVDLQWSDLRPERGLFQRLQAAGAVERLVTDDQVAAAVHAPPADTRAYFRGTVLNRYGRAVHAASWDSVIFDVPGHDTLHRVPMLDPWRGTRAHVGELLDGCGSAAELVDRLGEPSA